MRDLRSPNDDEDFRYRSRARDFANEGSVSLISRGILGSSWNWREGRFHLIVKRSLNPRRTREGGGVGVLPPLPVSAFRDRLGFRDLLRVETRSGIKSDDVRVWFDGITHRVYRYLINSQFYMLVSLYSSAWISLCNLTCNVKSILKNSQYREYARARARDKCFPRICRSYSLQSSFLAATHAVKWKSLL